MARVNILSTKQIAPLLAGKAAVQGIRITMRPFIHIEHQYNARTLAQLSHLNESIPWIFTSHNAVEALSQIKRRHQLELPFPGHIYALQGLTADQCRSLFPMIPVKGTAPNATALANLIISNGEKELVFFCGNLRRQELPSQLKENGIALTEIQVYHTVSVTQKLDTTYDGIMFFSPSGVHSFFEHNLIKSGTVCFAIGETTASVLRQYSTAKVRVAEFPTQESITNLVIEYYQQA